MAYARESAADSLRGVGPYLPKVRLSGEVAVRKVPALGDFVHRLAVMASKDKRTPWIFGKKSKGAELWHVWTVTIPRRSITGRLVSGRVWRRYDGRRWQYKKFVGLNQGDTE